MELKKDKKAIRKKIKELKGSFSPEELKRQSVIIQEKVINSHHFKGSKNILLYMAMADEVGTRKILNQWHKIKNLYLPVVRGNDLEIVIFEGEDKMRPGEKYGIPEPVGNKIKDESIIEMVIVPGVAFDKNKNRLGRGAGYYDRILKRIPNAWKTGLAFDFQIFNNLPAEPHDIRMDEIISVD